MTDYMSRALPKNAFIKNTGKSFSSSILFLSFQSHTVKTTNNACSGVETVNFRHFKFWKMKKIVSLRNKREKNDVDEKEKDLRGMNNWNIKNTTLTEFSKQRFTSFMKCYSAR